MVLNVKAVEAAFNQEKALVGAFSVITNLRIAFVWISSDKMWRDQVLAAQCRHYPCLNTAPPRSAQHILHTDYSQFVQVVNGETFINI